LSDQGRFLETFMLDSWMEHLRQHERVTLADRELQERVNSLHYDGEPKVTHLVATHNPAATIPKIGFDCTIPWGEKWVQSDFQRSAPFELGDPPAGVSPLTEDAIAIEMESLIRNAPRSWKELLRHFNGQNYKDVYRAFGRLRPSSGQSAAVTQNSDRYSAPRRSFQIPQF
jgi:Transmembrane secretion effector